MTTTTTNGRPLGAVAEALRRCRRDVLAVLDGALDKRDLAYEALTGIDPLGAGVSANRDAYRERAHRGFDALERALVAAGRAQRAAGALLGEVQSPREHPRDGAERPGG